MKIELSQEQIAFLVKNETERLSKIYSTDKQKLEKKHENEMKELANKFELETAKLASRFKFIEVAEPTPPKPKVKIDTAELKDMVAAKKTVREMAEYFKASESSIRGKLWNLKIKLSENK